MLKLQYRRYIEVVLKNENYYAEAMKHTLEYQNIKILIIIKQISILISVNEDLVHAIEEKLKVNLKGSLIGT